MEMGKIEIPIYMHSLLNEKWEELIKIEKESNPFRGSNFSYEYFGPRAQWLLSSVLSSLNLTRQDEIAILTTSDETYVTICVSIPSFNFAKISRVVTEKTKVVIVIHECGYIYPDIERKVEQWRAAGIAVIEDCAHIIGAEVNGRTVGSFGDYALFSLTKVIPGKAGGLLRTNHKIKLSSMNQNEQEVTKIGSKAANKYLSKYLFFNRRRIEKHQILKDGLVGKEFFETSLISVPYFTGIISNDKNKIQNLLAWVEWGATLRNNLLYIPTNPLVENVYYQNIIDGVKNNANSIVG